MAGCAISTNTQLLGTLQEVCDECLARGARAGGAQLMVAKQANDGHAGDANAVLECVGGSANLSPEGWATTQAHP